MFLSERGDRLRRQQVDRILGRLTEKAGVPKVSPHRLRHTAATGYGGQSLRSIQQMLGHRAVAALLSEVEVDA